MCCVAIITGKRNLSGKVESTLDFSRLPFYAPSISVLELQQQSIKSISLLFISSYTS